MKLLLKLLPILLLLIALPSYAGDRHDYKPEPPPPQNIPDDGSNHNAFAIAVVIGLGVCAYYKCWKPKPVKAESGITPEIPRNEYTYTIKP